MDIDFKILRITNRIMLSMYKKYVIDRSINEDYLWNNFPLGLYIVSISNIDLLKYSSHTVAKLAMYKYY